MNLLLVVDDYLPDSIKVAAKMMHELALEFKTSGHKVTVITPKPNSFIVSVKNQLSRFILDEDMGIDIIRFPSGRIKNVNKVIRLFNEFLLPYRAWMYSRRFLSKQNYDLVVFYTPSIFWYPLIDKIKTNFDAKTYQILRDFFPHWAIDSGLLGKKSLLTKFLQKVEQKNYKIADTIGIQSPENIKRFISQNEKWKDKVNLLYNWADTKKESLDTNKGNSFRQKMNLVDKVIFFYGGNIGQAQDMKQLLNLALRMSFSEKDAFFIFLGEGDEVNLVKNFIETNQLKNCLYLPPVNQLEFKAILNEIDVGLFSLHPNHSSHNFPGKLLGYMQALKPILGCVNSGNDLLETVLESKSGFISLAGDEDSLYSNAIQLMNSKIRDQLGENAFNLLQLKFSTQSACVSILSHISSQN